MQGYAAQALRAELAALKVGGLNRRAIAAGVDADALEMAQNEGDKPGIIELIVQASSGLLPSGQVGAQALRECRALVPCISAERATALSAIVDNFVHVDH